MAADLAGRLKAATELGALQPKECIQHLRGIVIESSSDVTSASSDPEIVKIKEQAVQQLCEAYVKAQDAPGLRDMLTQLRSFFGTIPKAKTARLIRLVIDSIVKVPGSTALQVSRNHC